MPVYRDTRLAQERPLALFAVAPTVPLLEALEEVADAWTLRTGMRSRVVEEPHLGSGGYRIERAS